MKSRTPLLGGTVPWPESSAQDYLERGFWRGVSLDSILTESTVHSADRLAIVCGPRRISYAELDRRVTQLAGGFAAIGMMPADCVVVQLANCLEAVETYLALFRLGAVPVLALPGHRESEITGFVRHTGATTYICAPSTDDFDFVDLARRVSRREKSLRHVIVVGDPQEFHSLESLRESAAEFTAPAGHEVALLQLSGGSTGTPKLIPRTHDDYLYSVETSARACGYSSSTVCLIALPLAHNFPMSSPGFLGCLSVGGTVVLCPETDADVAFPLMLTERITDVALVPPLAHAWLLAARSRKLKFPALEVVQVGGAKLDPLLAQEIRDGFSCQLQQVFGMAEGLVCNTLRHATDEQVMHTQGAPMSEADEVIVVDEQDRPVKCGEVGHLLTRGPYTIRGYFRAAETNRLAFTEDGFYRTGDLVLMRPDNHIVVMGRAKEIINRGGEKVSPTEVEQKLRENELIQEVAVVGQKDSLLGERICAFVVAKIDSAPTRESLLAQLRESGLATFKLPDRIEFLKELPKTRVGKIDKLSLSASQESSSTRFATDERSLDLRAQLALLLEVEATSISDTANLLEFGLDSIRIMVLVERFREKGREISFVEIAEEPTLVALERKWVSTENTLPASGGEMPESSGGAKSSWETHCFIPQTS